MTSPKFAMQIDALNHLVEAKSLPLNKTLVTGTLGVAIPGATEFAGIVVTVILASAFARFYDNTAAQGEYFCQLPITAIGQQVFPQTIKLTNGLWVAPSSTATLKFWVLWR